MSKLYVYIKTPQVDNSNACAHIVEHCVLNRDVLSPQDFYTLCDIKGESYSGYTRYDLYKKVNLESFIQWICGPLDKKVCTKEMLAFKEETKEEIFPDILKKKVEKLIYGKDRESKTKDYSRTDITAYHKKQYKRNNMVICTSEYKILENNIPIKTPWKWVLDIKKHATVSIQWEKNTIIVLPYAHWKSQVLLYFIEFLYDTYIEYTERYIKGEYSFPTACMIEIEKYVCIAIPQSILCEISPDFLDAAKKHFCFVSMDEYARKIEIINLLSIWHLPTDKDIKDFIMSIDIDTVKKIIT